MADDELMRKNSVTFVPFFIVWLLIISPIVIFGRNWVAVGNPSTEHWVAHYTQGLMLGILSGPITLPIAFAVVKLVKSARDVEPNADGACSKRGYDLRGLLDSRCPECGTRFDRQQSQ